MKYSYMKEKNDKKIVISAFDSGVLSDEFDANGVEECNNMWFKNGALTTRPGLYRKNGDFVFVPDRSEYIEQPPKNSGVRFNMNGYEYDVVSVMVSDAMSYYKLCMFFADSNGRIINANEIKYSRITDDEFYVPQKYFFFTASPTVSSGLYLFVTAANIHAESIYSVYEYVSETSSWRLLDDTKYYIPTLYINGRGSSYITASANGMASEEEPMYLEEQNMLGGWFYCYFSSDGYSSDFKLPLKDLDDDTVICRVYSKADAYFEWVIPAGNTEATEVCAGYDITLKCDRVSGVLQFFNNEEAFPIFKTVFFPTNNIRVMAKKSLPLGEKSVIGSSFAESFGSRIYVGGNNVNANEVYYSRRENPLYFTKGNSIKVGNSTGAVNALVQRAGDLYLFKSDEVYRLAVTEGKQYTVKDFNADDNLKLYRADTVNSILICSGIGCTDRNSLLLCNGDVIWRGNDGKVYMLNASKNTVIHISKPVDKLISGFKKVDSTAFYNGFYIMFFKNRIYLFDVKNSTSTSHTKPIWFCWELPDDVFVSAVVVRNGKLMLICHDENKYCFYISMLNGEEDNYVIFEDNAPKETKLSVLSGFTSAYYNGGTEYIRKSFDGLFMCADCKGKIHILCNTEEFICDFCTDDNSYKTIRINPHIKGECGMKFKVWSDEKFSVLSAVIKYRELGEVR